MALAWCSVRGALRGRVGGEVPHATRLCGAERAGTRLARELSGSGGGSSTVFAWGNGDHGQLGQAAVKKSGLLNHYAETAPRTVAGLEGQGAVEVAAGFKHSACVTGDGRVLTWGKSADAHLLGHAGSASGGLCLRPTHVSEGLVGVHAVQVVCGGDHTCVLGRDGRVFSWGSGGNALKGAGAVGSGDGAGRARAQQVLFGGRSEGVRVVKLASGKNHVLALDVDGLVWSWGRGRQGQLGNGSISDQLEPFPVDFFMDIDVKCVDIACGDNCSFAVSEAGEVFSWGENNESQLGFGTSGYSVDLYSMETLPRLVEALKGKHKVVTVGAGYRQAIALTDKGEVFFWGDRTWIEPHKMTALAQHRIVQADCGPSCSAVLSDAGQVFTWGRGFRVGQSGVLGHGDKGRHAQPELVQALAHTSIARISTNALFCLAVTGKPDIPKLL